MSESLDRELNLKAIAGFAVGLLLVIAASAAFLWYFSKFLRGLEEAQDPSPPALAAARAPYSPPGPRLQVDPEQEMAELRAEEDAVLETYGWVDEAAGVARIPIDRAIALMLDPETVNEDDGGSERTSVKQPGELAH